jgi:hypothetical protein
MPNEENKSDPFKPQQPRIPGVSNGAETRTPVHETPGHTLARTAGPKQGVPFQMPPTWILLSIGGALLAGIIVAWWTRGSPTKDTSQPLAIQTTSAPVTPPKPAEKLPIGPGPVATTDELVKPWSSRKFFFQDPATTETVPAMVVHLPGGSNWAFSLQEPYGKCTLEYVEDMGKLETEYNFRGDHPMVGDPCNHSLFDLARYGAGPTGLVRGQVIQGTAVRPPIAIEIRTKGKQIVAVRME